MRNWLAFFLIIVSFLCLVPGLVMNMMTLEIGATLPFLGKLQLYRETRSILGTVSELNNGGYRLVASLIFLFSVIVPVTKGALLLAVLAFRNSTWRLPVFRFIGHIGKWSMADVFVVGIFIAFLSAGAAEGITAQLHEGFYYFLAYCIISVAAVQIMNIRDIPAPPPGG